MQALVEAARLLVVRAWRARRGSGAANLAVRTGRAKLGHRRARDAIGALLAHAGARGARLRLRVRRRTECARSAAERVLVVHRAKRQVRDDASHSHRLTVARHVLGAQLRVCNPVAARCGQRVLPRRRCTRDERARAARRDVLPEHRVVTEEDCRMHGPQGSSREDCRVQRELAAVQHHCDVLGADGTAIGGRVASKGRRSNPEGGRPRLFSRALAHVNGATELYRVAAIRLEECIGDGHVGVAQDTKRATCVAREDAVFHLHGRAVHDEGGSILAHHEVQATKEHGRGACLDGQQRCSLV